MHRTPPFTPHYNHHATFKHQTNLRDARGEFSIISNNPPPGKENVIETRPASDGTGVEVAWPCLHRKFAEARRPKSTPQSKISKISFQT
jgi:hypothetical protein